MLSSFGGLFGAEWLAPRFTEALLRRLRREELMRKNGGGRVIADASKGAIPNERQGASGYWQHHVIRTRKEHSHRRGRPRSTKAPNRRTITASKRMKDEVTDMNGDNAEYKLLSFFSS